MKDFVVAEMRDRRVLGCGLITCRRMHVGERVLWWRQLERTHSSMEYLQEYAPVIEEVVVEEIAVEEEAPADEAAVENGENEEDGE